MFRWRTSVASAGLPGFEGQVGHLELGYVIPSGEAGGPQLFGTASEVVDRIDEYADAGAQGLNIALRAPFNFEALQAFAEEVLPAFK